MAVTAQALSMQAMAPENDLQLLVTLCNTSIMNVRMSICLSSKHSPRKLPDSAQCKYWCLSSIMNIIVCAVLVPARWRQENALNSRGNLYFDNFVCQGLLRFSLDPVSECRATASGGMTELTRDLTHDHAYYPVKFTVRTQYRRHHFCRVSGPVTCKSYSWVANCMWLCFLVPSRPSYLHRNSICILLRSFRPHWSIIVYAALKWSWLPDEWICATVWILALQLLKYLKLKWLWLPECAYCFNDDSPGADVFTTQPNLSV